MAPPGNRVRLLIDFLVLTVAAVVYLTGIASVPAPIEEPDSHTYVQFADAVRSGEFLHRTPETLNFPEATRTIGYPLVIALTKIVFGDRPGSILIGHSLLGLLAVVAVPLAFRRWAPVWLSSALVLLALFDMGPFFPLILTEWSALVVLLLIGAAGVKFSDDPGIGGAVLLGLLAASAVLIRPALLPVVPIVFVLPFLRLGVRGLVGFLVGLVPLFLWLALNVSRFGAPTLTAFDGYQLFGVGSIVGSAEVRPDDPEPLKTFIADMNAAKVPPAGSEAGFVAELRQRYHAGVYDHNIYQVALKHPLIMAMNPIEVNETLREYGQRAIRSAPERALIWLWTGLTLALSQHWILLSGFFGALALRRRATTRAVGSAVLLVLAIHVAHSVLCAAVQNVGWRYHNLTFVPFGLIATLGVAALLIDLGAGGFRTRPPGA